MPKKTSINIQAMKPDSEIHNMRRKDLDYIRKNLTHLNESWTDPRYEGKSFSEIRQDIAARYKEHVGQKMQPAMKPLREGVVVIDDATTMEQLQELATAMERKFGIKTMQIHIHRDEGYPNAEAWTPNLHAHMVFDWTLPDGRSLSLSRTDMAQLQTLAADVLGMERGESSDRKHLSAIQYKNKKEGERLLVLQQQNTELQAQVEEYQQSNEQLRSENEDLLLKAEEIRKTVDSLQSDVRKLKITKKGKQALLIGLNKITNLFGKSDLLIEKEQLEAKVKEAEKELAVWKGKVEKLQTDLARRTAERDKARKETDSVMKQNQQKDLEIGGLRADLRKSKKENLRLGRIAEPWKHVVPNVVNLDRCDIMAVPGGHTLRVAIKGYDRMKLYSLGDDDYQSYLNGDLSLEHLIGMYATREIDVAVSRRLQRMNSTERALELSKLAGTMFHALPAILYPALAAKIPTPHSANDYVAIHHKSRDEILRDMIDQGYHIRR